MKVRSSFEPVILLLWRQFVHGLKVFGPFGEDERRDNAVSANENSLPVLVNAQQTIQKNSKNALRLLLTSGLRLAK